MAFTYVYKRRVGPWGLVARVTLDVRPVDEMPREARGIDGSCHRWIPSHGLAPADARWMAFGLGLVARQLDALLGGAGRVVVQVVDWDVPMLADYQEEVAAAAVIECLRQNYGIRGVAIGLSFDRERNRYGFTWDGAPARVNPSVLSGFGETAPVDRRYGDEVID
ncbi:hypothetical protein [Streptomyces similanensis]|uniref:Uncharacterized protein n=1 Tax=Streptomyces similanensis TaxID=1274988 RepID=A0ABP9KF01_9ACTN